MDSHRQSLISTPGFSPLFHLLDEFDRLATENRSRHSHFPKFSPKFDVRELDNAYELHGEIAGVNKKDIKIEFTDDQTMVVRGFVERSYTSGNPALSAAEDTMTTALATAATETSAPAESKPATAGTSSDNAKFWISERSVGEFSRVFTFPTQVEHDSITAQLSEGILNIHVPKSTKKHVRHVTIQ